jgi:hypothetical protein
MVSENSVADPATRPGTPTYPVGLRLLRLWGYPFRRAHLVSDQTSVFLYPLFSSAALLGTIYVIGLLVAAHEGVLGLFFWNPLVPALLGVTGWSAVWISWAGSVYHRWGFGGEANRSASGSVPTLRLNGELSQRLKAHWTRLCNLRQASRYAIPAVVAAILYVAISLYGPSSWWTAIPESIRTLYAHPNQSLLMFLYLAAVAAILADVGSFGLFFTWEHLRFISEFVAAEKSVVGSGSSTTVKMLYLARKPLQELAYASFLSSMAWFGAVSILVVVFVVELNPITAAGLVAMMVLGLYVFLRPQWEFHQLISAAKTTALDELEGTLGSDWYDKAKNAPKAEYVPTLVLAQNVAAISDWHVDVRLVIAQIIGALFPLVAAIFGGPLGIHIG